MAATLRDSYTETPNLVHKMANAAWARSESFLATDTYSLTSVKLLMARFGSPGDTYVDIWTESGGLPNTLIQTSDAVDLGLIATYPTQTVTEFPFSTPVSITSGTSYCVVLRSTNSDASNYIYWTYRKSTLQYADGEPGFDNGGTPWTNWGKFDAPNNDLSDFYFETWGEDVNVTKTFTADASIAKDNVTKAIAADVSLKQIDLTKTITADVHTAKLLTIATDVSLKQIDLTKTITADVSLIINDRLVTLTADVHVNNEVTDTVWPLARAQAYEPDKFWDEETKAWYAAGTEIGSARLSQAGGRLRQNLVVLSNQGRLYFGVS